MKRILLYISILLFPFLIMVLVNELVRPTLNGKSYQIGEIKGMNSNRAFVDKCSWECYLNTTSHCKKYHTTFSKPYFKYIDPIYFGIIKSLHSGGNYQLMNVVFLVILLPLLMFYLLVRSIEMHYQIKAVKKTL